MIGNRIMVVILLAIAGAAAGAQANCSRLHECPVKDLKAIYLRCDWLATRVVLDSQTAGHCSIVAEQLLERGFDRDFERMLSWWRDARIPLPAVVPAAAVP